MIELEVLGNDPIELEVTMPTGGGGTINNQNKTVTPSLATQSVTADAGYTGLGTVTVNPMPSGSEGTPTATKGAVSNHSVDVTPSVTNTEGYIQGGTKTGTAVTVTASELVSGSETKTANGTYDVTNLASVVVDVDNSYTASDEGKVVSNGALVAQGSQTITENGTYDTTLVDDVTVNVSGGGGISVDDIAQNLAPSGAVTLSNDVTNIGTYAFYSKPITSITAPSAQYIGASAFSYTLIPTISDANFPSYKGVSSSSARVTAFKMMNELLTIRLSGALALDDGSGFMQTHNKLTHAEFPNATAVGTGNAGFRYNPLLEFVDLGRSTSVAANCFYESTTLRTLVLRNTSQVATLNGWKSSVLGGIYSNPTESTIYVPQALISSYQTATNWSTGYAQGLTFLAIEGSAHETKFSDGTPILTT